MNDELAKNIIATAAAVVITKYLPDALRVIGTIIRFFWKQIAYRVFILLFFVPIRLYRDKFYKYEHAMRFVKIKSRTHEFFYDWARWFRFLGSYPLSDIELRRKLQKERELEHFCKIQGKKFKMYLDKKQKEENEKDSRPLQ